MTNSWKGTWPKNCDVCRADLTKTDYFVDGMLKGGQRMWVLMCWACFGCYGVGLGPGKGQKYDSKTLQKLEG